MLTSNHYMYFNVQFISVAQSCPTLCDPTNCSTPGLPAHHQLSELVMPSNYLILRCPLLLLPSIFPSFSSVQFSSVQFSHSVKSDSSWPHEPQHARLPYPSSTARFDPSPCPLSMVMPSNHLILCHPLLLLPSIFPSIRVLVFLSFHVINV